MTIRPLDCEQCGQRVLIEKFSAAHTSVQWTGEAGRCPVIAAQGRGVGHQERGCDVLRRRIDRAVREHALPESRIQLPTGDDIPRLH
ncbi:MULTISPECIES: hypothetical protein [Nocardia]|uniref:hypothetical protein n=1 Tax=Nocardia TaxID=1817 RepID=UPI0007EA8D15|nr:MULTISPECIES: hypothetical protein [Nocardia]MBF6277960.1 hypothetical protein [Nocardia nova]OBA55446.1 hypothetical protein A5789_20685 [Nocardia sp. 852002-51101_SCH5132738]OBB49713.1 hypothetical protein A5748_19265 [Nocardia sp. 852002-51244_SCH5132740]OBF66903.1 hypothetical protein A9X06_05295 [Mycobacterium sp. 852002-51759_SCH5129042]